MSAESGSGSTGTVYIVGAGPGPADLLTLRALDRIQRAEVVVHDRLISPEVMALVPPGAERICVGKASGHQGMSQAQINAVLIEQVRKGRHVVRLKGGDPYIFERGGEEVQALQAAGLTFEVVPGVGAASGCAATAGIALTHRDLAHSCTFLSGHLADDSTEVDWSELDWTALARPRQTRVFYRGVEHVQIIARQLIAHGLAPDTPAAIVPDGTRPGQRVWATGLAALAEQAPARGPRAGLLVIGETVALSPYFDGAQVTPASLSRRPVAASASSGEHFCAAEQASFYRVLAARRDMRHFTPAVRVENAVLQRVLQAAHSAPSVGLMQPWQFIHVLDPALRSSIAALIDAERTLTANALDSRGHDFLQLKVEGIRECGELLVAVLAPDDGTVFGRRTMPRDMALCSLACAIQNLWLAARVENLGLGWVSMFEPETLGRLLHLPAGAQPVAVLCLGPVPAFYDAPMLEQVGWRQARPLAEFVHINTWSVAAVVAPTSAKAIS